MACERCSRRKMRCSHVGSVMANTPTTDIAVWTVAVRGSAEVVADALDHQTQTFGALLDRQTQSIDALLDEVRARLSTSLLADHSDPDSHDLHFCGSLVSSTHFA